MPGLGRHGTAAVTSTPTSLAALLKITDPQLFPVRFVSLQPYGGNSALVYIGFNNDGTVTSTNYWLRLEIPAATIPSAPFFLDDIRHPCLSLADLIVLGTANDKLSVGWIPYI